jgi:hypothetical protein
MVIARQAMLKSRANDPIAAQRFMAGRHVRRAFMAAAIAALGFAAYISLLPFDFSRPFSLTR